MNKNNDNLLIILNEATKLIYGEAYFRAIANLIADECEADYVFMTEIDLLDNMAKPIVSLKHGEEIENISYSLENTPCFEVTKSCLGYFPKDAQQLFPKDEYLKVIGVDGYLGVSIVPDGSKTPCMIITCLYKKEVNQGEHYFNVLQFIANNIQNRAERELLIARDQMHQTLLKEVHHRIKNNLQIVSSLLNIQKMQIKDPEAKKMITASQNRIQSIAFVHEMLHSSKDLKTASVKDYINNMVDYLLENVPEDKELNVKINSEDIQLETTRLVSMGMIINESISNTLKYAFAQQDKVEMHIDFLLNEHKYFLTLQDSGVGFSESVLKEDVRTTLGLEIISSLTNQLDGRVKFSNDRGAKIEIVFPE